MEVPTLTVVCREGRSPVHDTFLHGGCCPAAGTFLISWPRSRTRGRSAGAGIRWPGCWPWGSRRWSRFGGSFAAIGQWCRRHRPGGAGRAGRGLRPGGGVRVRPGQPRCTRPRPRRWLHIRAVQAGGRLVIAIDGKTVRDAKGKDGKAPHLVAVAVVVIRKKTSRYRVARSATNISGVSHRTLVV